MKPMLANPLEIDKLAKYQHYLVEVKLDGVRCIAIKDKTGVQLLTRSGKSMTEKVPHIVEQLRDIHGDFIIDGELGYLDHRAGWCPVMDFNKTMRIIGSDQGEAINKQLANIAQGSEPIKFVVFDILKRFDHSLLDSSQAARSMALNNFALGFLRYKMDLTTEAQHTRLLQDGAKTIRNLYERSVDLGAEGIMLKNPDAQYYPGARKANTWYKLKKFNTADVVIMGSTPGQGKYSGQIGALTFGAYRGDKLILLGRCSGMTDEMREQFTERFVTEELTGYTMEIRYFGKVGRDGTGLRHPQFVRLRPDKNPRECQISDL